MEENVKQNVEQDENNAVNQDLTDSDVDLNKKKKIKPFSKKTKKRIILISILSVIVLSVAVFFIFIFPKNILPGIYLNSGNKAFDKGDYVKASACYSKSSLLASSPDELIKKDYADGRNLFDNGEYAKAGVFFHKELSFSDSEDYAYQCGMKLIDQQDYAGAANVLENITVNDAESYYNYAKGIAQYDLQNYNSAEHYMSVAAEKLEEAKTLLPKYNYDYGKYLFNEEEYSKASEQFKKAGEYEDSKKYVTGCLVMQAESSLKKGYLHDAYNQYNALPSDFTFNGISVLERKKNLSNGKAFVNICGKWSPTSNYIESRNVYNENGSWEGWNIDKLQTDQSLIVECKMNDDGTFNISGSVSFYRFSDYSSLRNSMRATIKTESFTEKNLSNVPSSIRIDENTVLKYSSSGFVLEYRVKDPYSIHFTNHYNTTVNFGKISVEY